MYKDWCPLCGSRFEADTSTKVAKLIISHIDDKTCENNFKPFLVALNDDSFEKYDTGKRYQP